MVTAIIYWHGMAQNINKFSKEEIFWTNNLIPYILNCERVKDFINYTCKLRIVLNISV
jgi:hypothetical protein